LNKVEQKTTVLGNLCGLDGLARMFRHGHANTTNLVECMWQYIKYTLLDGKVNRRLDELVFALIGNLDTGQRFGGLSLDEHYNNVY